MIINYYDIRPRAHKLAAVSIIIGGRGIGKTYSSISFMLEQDRPFIYLRNTAVQMDESASVFGNPFKKVSKDLGRDIRLEAEKKHYVINEYLENGEKKLLGYGAALSTFGNLRGVDLSDAGYCLFDEFIERRTLSFNQWDNFQQFYETVNRNRELEGEEPFKCILLSNSQTLQNDILQGYGLVNRIIGMKERGEHLYREPGLYLELPESEVSDLKAKTANYRLIAGTDTALESLSNEFAYDSFTRVKKQPIREYMPVCMAGDPGGSGSVCFYRHKSSGGLYVSQTPNMNCKIYDKEMYTLFMRERGLALRELIVQGRVYYEDYNSKIISDHLFKL